MIQKHRRRGMMARLKRLLQRVAPGSSTSPDLQQPVRALPEKIMIVEEYRYTLAVARTALYNQEPDKRVGEIQVDLPFDRMGREAMADMGHATRGEAGAITGRYGWLGLTKVVKTDIVERFSAVREWSHAPYSAFPLVFPMLDEQTERLENRIEAGRHEREFLYYTPRAPKPFPFTLSLFMARDAAVPSEPRPAGATPSHRLTEPSIATGKEMAIHVHLDFLIRRPSGVTEETCTILLDRFSINWPVPLVASHFTLRDAPPGSRLWVDHRFNQLVVEGVKATFVSTGSGLLRAHLGFRILIKQPAVLQGTREMKGMMKLMVSGVPLSGVRAQFFDATGYPHNEDGSGKPLVEYRTDIFANFTYRLADALREPPTLLERHYGWISSESSPNPFHEVQRILEERTFEIDPTLSEAAGNHRRWWATRLTDGQPLILDVRMEQRTLPRFPYGSFAADPKEARTLGESSQRSYCELTIVGYYRGRWEEAVGQIERIEERLRQRLHLRHHLQ